jgi:hypothetical protein
MTDIVTAFVIRFTPSSVLRRPRSETNANRARGRAALPDGDRWPPRDSRLDRRGQNLTKRGLLGAGGGDVKLVRGSAFHARASVPGRNRSAANVPSATKIRSAIP